MKTRFTIPFLAFLLVILSAGCVKNNPSTSTPTSYKVKSVINIHTDISNGQASYDTSYYTYDTAGRVTMVRATGGNCLYTYGTTAVTISVYMYPAAGSGTISGGLITNVHFDGYSPDPASDATCTYDTDGYLTQIVNVQGGVITTTQYTWTNGNLSSIQLSGSSSAANSTYTYNSNTEYRDNGFSVGTPYLNNTIPGIIFGKNSKNLVSTMTQYGTIYNYTYTFDSKGRVATQTQVGNNISDVYKYTYN